MYTPHSVGLLWASDRPLSETSTPKHTAVTTDNAPGGIWTRNPSKRAAARLRLRLRSEWLRIRPYFYTDVYGRRRTAASCGHIAFSYGSVQMYSVQISAKRITLLKMETDSMFLLDTNPLLKILIFEEQKDMWVNESFEGKEKRGGFWTPFPQLLEQLYKFYDYFKMLPETFWYTLNDIRDDIQKQSHFITLKYCKFMSWKSTAVST